MNDTRREEQTAYLVGVRNDSTDTRRAESLLAELHLLVRAIGIKPVGAEIAQLREPTAGHLLGSGKVAEIGRAAAEAEATFIVVDESLSPRQQRNWETATTLGVLDRQAVILDIFAARAQTREAIIQVDLAQLEYFLPRLTNAWSHLSRQRGGKRGTRGEGEKQLELDRRGVQHRIAGLRRELKHVESQRATMRRSRSESSVPTGSIVGYTNAGKSSLLRALTGTEAFVANQLFATLDPATRRLDLREGGAVLLTDTVGFVRRLPHTLIAAFKSTLEETVLSDFLVHVLDGSDPDAADHYEVTCAVLAEIGVGEKPTIVVLNKADVGIDSLVASRFPEAVTVSTRSGAGIAELEQEIGTIADAQFRRVSVTLPSDRYDLAALIHRTGHVIDQRYDGNQILIQAAVPLRTCNLVAKFAS